MTATVLPAAITLPIYLEFLLSSSTYIIGILTWYIYAKIIKGTEDTSPLYVNLKASILAKFSFVDWTSYLSVKNTHITAKLKYIEHKTPKSDENLKALAFLGIDIGNMIPKANIAAEIILPVVFSPKTSNKSGLVEYLTTILGIAFFT